MMNNINESDVEKVFLNKGIDEQVKYLNSELDKGMKVKEIRDKLNVSEKKLQRIIKKNGYKYNQKTKKYESSTKVLVNKSEPCLNFNGEMDNKALLGFIKELNEMKEINTKVVEMYNWYKMQTNVIEQEKLEINTRENKPVVVKSYKIYCDTEGEFKKLCKKYSQYKVQDLISKALDEFILRYK